MKARCLVLCLLLFVCSLARAESIEGIVTNGTRNRPQASAAISLLKLDQGMQPIRETTTDTQGRYRFADVPADTGASYLVRVTYAGVTYHKPALFQSGTAARVDVEVYERTSSEKAIAVDVHGIAFDPSEGRLRVREAYAVANQTRPPLTVYGEGGTFRFALPTNVKDVELSMQAPTGMPLEQTPVEKLPGQYAVDFPLRPGTTQVRLSYSLDYPVARAQMALRSFYAVNHTQVFIPSTGVELSSRSLTPLGTDSERQLSIYGAENLSAGSVVEFEVSGTAPAAARAGGEGDSANQAGSVTIFPNAAGQARWYIVILAFFVLVLGLYYLYQADGPAESGPAKNHSQAKRRPRRATEPIDDHTSARR